MAEGYPGETFIEQVKQALENLYDFPSLQRHPLANGSDNKTAGQQLRRELIDAIETLNPGTEFFFRSPHARLYNLLHLHYVEGLTIQESANELGISVRQAYRDLRRGEMSIAQILWANRTDSLQEAAATELSSVQSEVALLEPDFRPVDVRVLLNAATRAVERLAIQHHIHLEVDMPASAVTISTHAVVAQQVLVNILSHTIQQAEPDALWIGLQADGTNAALKLHYAAHHEEVQPANTVILQLIDRLGWRLEQHGKNHQGYVVLIEMAANGPKVLIIDDNQGLVDLLNRYLTGHTCRVVGAKSGQEGLQLAQNAIPDAIVLDVMMPEMDGWELLQRLRAHPQTENIPIIICSVFNDPELAYSLGASLFLPKPVSRDEILDALRKLNVV